MRYEFAVSKKTYFIIFSENTGNENLFQIIDIESIKAEEGNLGHTVSFWEKGSIYHQLKQFYYSFQQMKHARLPSPFSFAITYKNMALSSLLTN